MAEVRIIQGNMHRSKVASNLLRQIQAEREVDLLLVSEQYDNPNVQIANPGAVPAKKKGKVSDTSGLKAGG